MPGIRIVRGSLASKCADPISPNFVPEGRHGDRGMKNGCRDHYDLDDIHTSSRSARTWFGVQGFGELRFLRQSYIGEIWVGTGAGESEIALHPTLPQLKNPFWVFRVFCVCCVVTSSE